MLPPAEGGTRRSALALSLLMVEAAGWGSTSGTSFEMKWAKQQLCPTVEGSRKPPAFEALMASRACQTWSIANAHVSEARVRLRTLKGGHDVPSADIYRRFLRTHRNFWKIYRPLAHNWDLIFNGPDGHIPVAKGSLQRMAIENHELWRQFQDKVQES